MSKATDLRQDGVKIMLDKERTLLFDLNAMVDLEEEYGDIEAVFKKMASSGSGRMKAIRKMIWLGLKHEDEELTEKQAGFLITVNNIEEISKKINESFSSSMPDVDEKNK